jgi:hypothetical protein
MSRRPPATHHLAGWLLITTALAAGAVGVGVRWWSGPLSRWTSRPVEELNRWWLPAGLAVICLVALLVGCRLAFQRRARSPGLAKRAADGNHLVELEPLPPTPPPAPVPAQATRPAAAAAEAPAVGPPDQARGLGWARASDAAQGGTGAGVPPTAERAEAPW